MNCGTELILALTQIIGLFGMPKLAMIFMIFGSVIQENRFVYFER